MDAGIRGFGCWYLWFSDVDIRGFKHSNLFENSEIPFQGSQDQEINEIQVDDDAKLLDRGR
jgi:hypothetical protein